MGVLLMAVMLNLLCSVMLASDSAELAVDRIDIYTVRIKNNNVCDFVKDSFAPLERYLDLDRRAAWRMLDVRATSERPRALRD
jgi:hypothetical protein